MRSGCVERDAHPKEPAFLPSSHSPLTQPSEGLCSAARISLPSGPGDGKFDFWTCLDTSTAGRSFDAQLQPVLPDSPRRPEPEICVTSPGFDEDLIVRTDPESFVQLQLKMVSLKQAMHGGGIEVIGSRTVMRQLRAWSA